MSAQTLVARVVLATSRLRTSQSQTLAVRSPSPSAASGQPRLRRVRYVTEQVAMRWG
jgi:hypothetical protein